tara:strand:- start:204 stop:461 length:258 start_codon:yes stop_codon:yes gene_type:complete
MIGHEQLIEFAIALFGSAVFALVGFVWKISHKVNSVANRLDGLVEIQKKDTEAMQRDIDIIVENVDKNREWTTSRMMSIVRDSKD